MEPSCGGICNLVIVWLDEFAVVKILDRIEKPTGCPRFDPVFDSNNNPLFGPFSIMIIAEHFIFVGVTTVVWHLGRKGGNPPTSIVFLRGERYNCVICLIQKRRFLGHGTRVRSLRRFSPDHPVMCAGLQHVFFTMMCVVYKPLGSWRHHKFWSFVFMIATSP